MEKLLTLIVPCYNMEQYLDCCIESLCLHIEEHKRLLDILIINDGSQDSTSQIAHLYEIDFPDVVTVVDKENGHYGSCINVGLALATGQYVKILEPDDVFDKDGFVLFLSKLQQMDALGQLDTIDMILTDFAKNTPCGEIISKSDLCYPPYKLMEFDEFQETLEYHILLPAVTYRLSIFRDLKYHQTEGVPYTDIEWLSVPMRKIRKIMYFPIVVYKYLLGRDGQSVEQNTYISNVHVILKMLLRLFRQYDELLDVSRPAVQKYVDKVLLAQASIVYQAYLIHGGENLKLDDLREFDNLFKCMTPVLYKEVDLTIKSSFFVYHYVRCFRKSILLNLFIRHLFFIYVRLSCLRNWLRLD